MKSKFSCDSSAGESACKPVNFRSIGELTARCLKPKTVSLATVFGLSLLLTQSAVSETSDILFLHSDARPVSGLIESESDARIVFQVFRNSDHSFSRLEFQRKDIKDIVRTVDQQRLESLTIDRLSDYRDLAEELSSLSNDPVARHMALRLSLLCLHHADSTEQGRAVRESAAANLLTLARNDLEREQFRLIAFLAGHSDNRQSHQIVPAMPDPAVDKTMLQIVTAIRQENFVEASRLLDSESGKKAMKQWSKSCSPELLRAAIGQPPTEPLLLARLLSIEVRIRYGDDLLPPIGHPQGFANSHNLKPSGPVWIPDLPEIFQFDPEETDFKDGQWQKPD